MNPTVLKLKNSATVALSDKIRQYKEEGRNIIALQTGDPDFETPKIIIDACTQALSAGLTHYSFSQGLPELREEIASVLEKKFGAKVSADKNLLITNGGIHAFFLIMQALLIPGDEVLIIDPSWMPYKSIITLVGGIPIAVEAEAENNFIADVNSLRKRITKATKAIVINSPNNPTGAILTNEYLSELVKLAMEHELYIISDEVYNEIIFDNRKPSSMLALDDQLKCVIVINSFSKTFAMTGWRIGYLVAAPEIITQCLKLAQYTITNVPAFVQKAAAIALRDSQVQLEVKNMVKTYEKRRNAVHLLSSQHMDARIKFINPEGAFYIFWDIRQMKMSSDLFCEALLDKYQVAVVPGSVYGMAGEGFVRMTIAAKEQDIMEGSKKLLEFSK